ncbi:MAG TPA: type II 3-dehydroquinate dehydratase [Acidimicrobiales bacterium]|nr:type II 3-dehydroquinate dehydratase [Acidimicrobiales bacterium]
MTDTPRPTSSDEPDAPGASTPAVALPADGVPPADDQPAADMGASGAADPESAAGGNADADAAADPGPGPDQPVPPPIPPAPVSAPEATPPVLAPPPPPDEVGFMEDAGIADVTAAVPVAPSPGADFASGPDADAGRGGFGTGADLPPPPPAAPAGEAGEGPAGRTGTPIVLLLSGPNLNLLGTREPGVYGTTTLQEHVARARTQAEAAGLAVEHVQSNHEGELVDAIQKARGRVAAIVINPGAFTHYAWGIHDALRAFEGPVVEVHLSNPDAREPWRHTSVVSPVATGTITGLGGQGYDLAIRAIDTLLA